MDPQFNTLVQSGTAYSPKLEVKLVVSGEGTALNNNPVLAKRAKRKVITQSMNLILIDIAKQAGNELMQKAYWNTFYCQHNVITSKGKLYSNYCKNRFCTICCAIRKAELINKYYPILKDWEDAYFVTLTVKACKAKSLKKYIDGMLRAFNLIHRRCKKRYQRSNGIKLIGIKSLECNFNPITKTYNPHFHIIVPNLAIAELLRAEWLFQWKSDKRLFTSWKAQDITKVRSVEHAMVEIIKYGSKIFTEPDLKKKGKSSVPPTIYAAALNNILTAMKGRRIFDRFGFNLPKVPLKEPKFSLLEDYQNWSFSIEKSDWVNNITGERMTNYKKPPELTFLLNNCVNLELE